MSDIYKKLRERLDMFPQGFPQTKSGVELDILKHLFNRNEAEIMLFLRPYPELVSTLAQRMDRDEKELGEILYDMSKRGLILRYRASEEEIYFFMAPWMIGIWEFQVNNLNKENVGLYEKYFEEGIVSSKKGAETAGFRVIPIEREIEDSTEIQPFEKVSEIINAQTRFAVADCICRKEARIMGEGCDKLLETCMSFGPAADYYIENGLGREITKEEAMGVLTKAEEEGLIHFSSNHKDQKIFVCNCCGCCCKALLHMTKYDNPAIIAKSNYYAVLDQETCTSCETCIDRCQVNAIQIENDLIEINKDRCIGCGLCASACPSESITMAAKLPHEASAAYANDMDLIQSMAKAREKPFPFE